MLTMHRLVQLPNRRLKEQLNDGPSFGVGMHVYCHQRAQTMCVLCRERPLNRGVPAAGNQKPDLFHVGIKKEPHSSRSRELSKATKSKVQVKNPL